MMITSWKWRPRNSVGRFWLTIHRTKPTRQNLQQSRDSRRLSPINAAVSLHLDSTPLETAFSGVDFQTLPAIGVGILKTIGLLFGAALLSASVAMASDVPAAEVFLGYNFVHFDPSTPAGFTDVPSFNSHGGHGEFAYNFTSWIGGVMDIGAVRDDALFGTFTNGNRPEVDHSLVNFVLGPRVKFHSHGRLQPFGQVLFGGARAKSSTSVSLLNGGVIWPPPGVVLPPGVLQPVSATLETERTGFAMLAGGGLNIKIGKHIAFRPIQADYYLTRLPGFFTGNDTNKNHFRYSAGVNFLFGAR